MSTARTDLRMTVGRLAREDVVTVPPDAAVSHLAQVMADRRVGSLVVVEDDVPVGIVTDRDLALELLAEGSDLSLFDPDVDGEAVTAADVMTAEPRTVGVEDELPRVLHHMAEARARRLPVVDADGRLAGILTLDDVLVHLAGESAHVSAQLDALAEVVRAESPES